MWNYSKIYKSLGGIICCIFIYTMDMFAQSDSSKIKYLQLSLEEILNLKVTTALKTPGKLSDVPATFHLITHEQIRTNGYRNLEEVLEDIPELEIQKRSSAEYGNYYTLRGVYGTEKFIIMMDGMRINSPTGTPLAISNNYPVSNAKQIEIILGPASALYGVDAFTGIINIITYEGSEINGVRLNTSYGSFNTSNNSLMWGAKYDEISFSLMGNLYTSDEPDFPSIYPEAFAWYNDEYSKNGHMLLPNNSVVQTDIFDYSTPTLSYALHAKMKIKEFEVGYFRNYESHGSSFSVKPEYSIYSEDAIFGEWVESMYASHNIKLNNDKWNFFTSLSYSKDEIDPRSNYINSFTSYEKGYKYAFNKALKLEEQVTYFLGDNASIVGGFSLQDISALPKSGDLPHSFNRRLPANLQDMYYIGTNITDSAGNDLSITQDFYYLHYQNVAFYMQSHFNLGSQLTATMGARYDYNTRYSYSVNPRVGLVYSPLEKLRIKLLYGEAFFAPSPYSVFQHYGSFVPVRDSISGEVTGLTSSYWRLPTDEKLESQKIRTYETNFSYFLNKSLIFSLNGFYNNIGNLLSSEGYTGQEFHDIAVDYIQRPVNKGSAYTYGGTLKTDVKTAIHSFLVGAYLAYSFIDGQVEGNPLPFSAKHTVKGGVSTGFRKLNISTRLIYRSKSYHRSVRDSEGNIIFSPPFTVVNFAARYQVFRNNKYKIDAFCDIKNLFNVKYYNLPIGGSECFPNVPQDPIRMNVGLGFSL